MFVNSKRIHYIQIALYSKKSNFVSLDSLEFFLYTRFLLNINLDYNVNIIFEILDIEDLEIQTRTQIQIQIINILTSSKLHTSTILSNKYYILIISILLVVQLIKRLVEKNNKQHILKKFYISLAKQRMASKTFIALFAILKISQFVQNNLVN